MRGFDHRHSRDVEQPPGACLVLRTEEYLAMGGFDTDMSLFFNDVDLCRRLRSRGRRIRYLSEVEVMHHEGASTRAQRADRRNMLWMQNRAAYYRKNHGPLAERWLRVVLGLWALECRLRIRLGPRESSAKRAALAELDGFVEECARA